MYTNLSATIASYKSSTANNYRDMPRKGLFDARNVYLHLSLSRNRQSARFVHVVAARHKIIIQFVREDRDGCG